MKSNMLLILMVGFIGLISKAQMEQLYPIQKNTAIYAAYQKALEKKAGSALYNSQGNVIILNDTLPLPFIDDFSNQSLKSYNFNTTKIDSFVYAFGRCIVNGGYTMEEYPFVLNPSFRYFFNTTTKTIDSIANNPAVLYFIDSPTLCFSLPVLNNTFYPASYKINKVDTSSGRILDSSLVKSDTLIRLAKLAFTHIDTPIRWLDNYAYINATFPVDPPTIGVATLDGLNEMGLPYNKSSVLAYGIADFLTSRPIDLSGLKNDDSVFLSFFYEAKGVGDFPNSQDSLILEFKDDKDNWNAIWWHEGYNSDAEVPNVFKQILLKIPFPVFPQDPVYYYKGFQFRFKNYASLTGNNDHWHIDYVRLDKNRSSVDTLIKDVSFVYSMPSLLKEYTQMPADHFDKDTDLMDSLLIYNNYLGSPFQNDYCIGSDTNGTQSFKTCPIYNTAVNQIFRRSIKDFNIPNLSQDIAVIKTYVYTKSQADLSTNDTLVGLQIFSNLLSYDDGSAEKGYGLQGNGLKKFGYEFNFKKQDTLSGIRIHYTNIDENVKDLIFNINVWKSIELGTANDVLLKEIVNRKPTYIDPINSFIYYKLDTPLIITGKFYIGYTQTDLRNLQIGYDVNSTKGKDKMYVFSSGTWKKSTITLAGSPMIQAIVDGKCRNCVSGIETPQAEKIIVTLYPNPFQQLLHVETSLQETYTLLIHDMMGKEIRSFQDFKRGEIDLSDLQEGIYFLMLRNNKEQQVYRIVKE